MGKGSQQRPAQIPQEELRRRWEATFGENHPETEAYFNDRPSGPKYCGRCGRGIGFWSASDESPCSCNY